jgi:hypothetical protein
MLQEKSRYGPKQMLISIMIKYDFSEEKARAKQNARLGSSTNLARKTFQAD